MVKTALREASRLHLKGGGTDLWGIDVHSAGRRFEDVFNFKA